MMLLMLSRSLKLCTAGILGSNKLFKWTDSDQERKM